MRIKDGLINWANQEYSKYEETIQRTQSVVSNRPNPFLQIRDAFVAVKEGAQHGAAEATRRAIADPGNFSTRLGQLQLGWGATSLAVQAVALPVSGFVAWRDFRQAAKSGSREDRLKSARSAGNFALGTVAATAEFANASITISRLRASYRAALVAFQVAAPHASEHVARAAARAAMRSTLDAASKQVTREVVHDVALAAARSSGAFVGSASRAAAKASVRAGASAASRAALAASARVSSGTLARVALRFAPGVNIGLAVVDVARAATALANPKASTAHKALACLTALGSVVAATNVPVFSQIGAGVSAVANVGAALT